MYAILGIVYFPVYSSAGALNFFLCFVVVLISILFLLHIYFIISTAYDIRHKEYQENLKQLP